MLEHCPQLERVGLTFPDWSRKLHTYTFQISNACHWAFVSDLVLSMPHRVPELVLEFGQVPDGMHSLSGVKSEITQRVEAALEDRYGGAYPTIRVHNSDGSVLGFEVQRLVRQALPVLSRTNALSFCV